MEILEALRIEGLAHGGAAVARAADGRVVFVRGGCPGDLLTAEVTADKGRFLEADVLEVTEPSPERRTPPCPYFGDCGGCQWQHVSHAAQVRAKRLEVADALKRIGGVSGVEVGEVVVGDSPYGYRNRLELKVGTGEGGRALVGLTAARSERLVPIDACLLLPDRARKLPKAIGGAIRYLAGRTPAEIGRISLRVGARTRDIALDLWGPPGPFPRQAVAKTLADAVHPSTVTRVLVKGDARERANLAVEVLSGKGHWRERLGGFTYRVSPPSFFQANTPLAERMTEMVVAALAPDGADRVLDLYAGVGTFTLPLAGLAGEVVAIEGTGSAVRDLRANLEEAGVWADVMPGDAARALADAGTFDLAVVDPPRSGMSADALAALARTRARRICYVSCDPATLARDVKALAEAGYRLESAVPVDLFPQTWHVETVATLVRAE